MKLMTIIALSLLSLSAFASFNEIECQGQAADKNVTIEVEQSFPTNSVFKRMLMLVTGNNTQESFDYTVTSHRFNGSNRILYQSSELRLEVDLWPDNSPRWGRTYRSNLRGADLNNGAAAVLDCRFPNAN